MAELARRLEQREPDLTVVTAECQALTGPTDAYAPFPASGPHARR